MIKIELTTEIPAQVSLICTEITFKNQANAPALWTECLNPLLAQIEQQDTLETIRENPTIQATKRVYKALGKDPARFRPSSDSLWRRAAKGQGLYQVNALVDLNNAVSLLTHLPFGSYDLDKVTAPLRLTVGQADQTYPGIGKKAIDLNHLMVLADSVGPFGSPTSDSTRAMITETTQHALIVGYGFAQSTGQQAVIQQEVATMVTQYLMDAKIVQQWIV
ncbi:B3/B4 domain-containing protein [Lacticaseibacillus saniviri]|uniref:B3/B4 tRNA-binding domain-containing protein n=1 Tax=Lacticaseibacillus saniviri JCM 17471 = DSM 24301 TaxID=1293598 RepID=A0A0R2MXN0_9LACO|nr:phenylalanine--tRNA ligase beta subunit-related protein [Lacticaseibacillus saniviri]KRO18414.1 hypothetical protein IV56_GL001548 [Lacticaseibacillus saniviri JCM 17471 = DSM 24301]MCG4281903.1 hypothetical protein [Lacticaseibacillus saniviri]